jgi:hypothetical protein
MYHQDMEVDVACIWQFWRTIDIPHAATFRISFGVHVAVKCAGAAAVSLLAGCQPDLCST